MSGRLSPRSASRLQPRAAHSLILTKQPRNCLVIGYGNELRRDDGLGPKLGRAIEAMNLPSVRVIIVHQLTPELAEDVSLADSVVFLDASADGLDKVRVSRIAPTDEFHVWTHASGPAALLAWAAQLFGKEPQAAWITMPGKDFGYGETLSPHAQRAMESAVNEFKKLLQAWRVM